MKASVYSSIRTLVDVQSEFSDTTILTGTSGTVVECYVNPESYAVDLRIPDDTLVGGASYENVILFPEQFEVVDQQRGAIKEGSIS